MQAVLSLPPQEVAQLAKAAFGEPNKALSTKCELRFGSKGSKSVNLEKSNGIDFETGQGFGLLDLIIWAGLANSRYDAAKYLENKTPQNESRKPTQANRAFGGGYAQKTKDDSWKPIWAASKELYATRGQNYLMNRSVLEVLPEDCEDLRFHINCPYQDGVKPCLVALIRDWQTGQGIGIQRTPISPQYERDGARMIKGGFMGGAIMLQDYHDCLFCRSLGVGEGLETTLSLRRLKGFEGLPLWCLVNDGNLGKFTPPPNFKHLVIAVDHDEGGMRNADKLEATAKDKGVKVTRIMNPTPKKDLNDFINEQMEKAA